MSSPIQRSLPMKSFRLLKLCSRASVKRGFFRPSCRVKLLKSAVTLVALLCCASVSHAQVPQLISYQGRVAVNGTNFNGTGQFKFALVNATGTTTFWSNGINTVSLAVSNGLYSVLLGDT